MSRRFLIVALLVAAGNLLPAQSEDSAGPFGEELRNSQLDLDTAGRAFLLKEAHKASFFLLGELHGENEIPTLLRTLWPELRKAGYAHIAAELSPWAAHELEWGPPRALSLATLWSTDDVKFVHESGSHDSTLWGCDMEEGQPDKLIRELAAINKGNESLT